MHLNEIRILPQHSAKELTKLMMKAVDHWVEAVFVLLVKDTLLII
jgi:hypothetical protein